MSISIKGRVVKKGDSLYNELNHAWGVVTEVFSMTITITHDVDGIKTNMTASYNGTINGLERLHWHVPLTANTTSSDISDIQRIVDTYVEEKNKWLR